MTVTVLPDETQAHWRELAAWSMASLLRVEKNARKKLETAATHAARAVREGATLAATTGDRSLARRSALHAVRAASSDLRIAAENILTEAHHEAAKAAREQHAAEAALLAWTIHREGGKVHLRTGTAAAPEDVGLAMRSASTAATLSGSFQGANIVAVSRWVRSGAATAPPAASRLPFGTVSPNVLERIAATESAAAYNQELEVAAQEVANDNATAAWQPRLMRVWSAVLDRRTCSECSEMDGAMVPAGTQFPGGALMPLHPRCRCIPMTILLPNATQGRVAGMQSDYGALKKEAAKFFRSMSATDTGRRHALPFYKASVMRGSPAALTRALPSFG